jgi:hypothetical protein
MEIAPGRIEELTSTRCCAFFWQLFAQQQQSRLSLFEEPKNLQ